MEEEKILTLHPEGKKGMNILKRRYDVIKDCVLTALREKGDLTYTQISEEVSSRVGVEFDGNIGWYTETLKLDLEARGFIIRIKGTKPELLTLTEME